MRWRNAIVAAGLMAWLTAPGLRAAGPLPAEFEPPEGTRLLAGLDLQALLRSPLWERVRRDEGGPLKDLQRLREETGLDVERDVDAVVLAGGPPREGAEHLLIHASGRFDSYQLGRAIEKSRKATWRSVAGNTLYLLGEGKGSPGALAFLGDHALVLGTRADVEALLEGRAATRSPLLDVAARVSGSPAFWMAVDGELARGFGPGASPAAGATPPAGPAGFALPPLRSILVSGDLEPQLRLELEAEALDELAARNLADAARGLITLAGFQAAEKPELQKLLAGVQVASQGSRATLKLAMPWELLDQLDKKAEPKPAPKVQAP